MRLFSKLSLGLLAAAAPAFAADPPVTSAPRPIPLTRPEMKRDIEAMKDRKPRIPLPELTEDEKTKLGERGTGYESRLRFHYMPAGSTGGGGGGGPRETDPAMTLDNNFKVELFWIVCRTNNCQYCQGHQEGKLLRGGLKEDEIAALDGDWSGFPAKDRAAFAFARKITYEPHRFGDADYKALKEHFTDLQVLEMLMSVAGNNQINRWKEGTGVPQSAGGGGGGRTPGTDPVPVTEKHTYLTPTSDKYKDAVTKVAPLELDDKGKPTGRTVSNRPALESKADTVKALNAAAERTSRLPLVDEEKARAAMPEGFAKDEAVPQWARLLANFASGKNRIASQIAADEKGDLKPVLKARVSWILARQDRAWYAAEDAKARLKKLGQTDDQIDALDGDWKSFDDTERSLFTLAKKLGASPVVLTDDDVAAALKLAGPKTVVQLIGYVTVRASFNRITEAAGLRAGK